MGNEKCRDHFKTYEPLSLENVVSDYCLTSSANAGSEFCKKYNTEDWYVDKKKTYCEVEENKTKDVCVEADYTLYYVLGAGALILFLMLSKNK
jgi:hypothetical protein